jgi:hypothetical protein
VSGQFGTLFPSQQRPSGCRNIAYIRVELFPRSVLKIFFTYLPGSRKRQDWVYLSSEQGVFNELGFTIVIMPSFEPNLNFI